MKILLTGATGFLGYRTLEKLVLNTAVDYITATGRTIKPSHHVQHDKVRYETGDLSDKQFTEKLVQGVDCIIHAAALSAPWGRYEAFHSANVVSQQNLLDAAKKYGVQRFIYISSPSIYFDGKDRFNIKESDPLPARFVNAYAATKRQAEVLLEESGIDYVILRPRALIGRGDTVIMPRLVKAFEAGKLRVMGDGKNIADLTSVANFVSAIELSLFVNGDGLNEDYNVTNGAPVQLWNCIEQVINMLVYKFVEKKIPFPIINTIAKLLELKARMTDYKEPVLTCYGVGTLARSFTMDISKAKAKLKYEPLVTTEEAMQEFVTWYKHQ